MTKADILLDALITDTTSSEALLGDLTEVRTERAEHEGVIVAERHHRREVLRSVPALLWHRLREAPVAVIATAVIGVLVIRFILVMAVVIQMSAVTALTGGLLPHVLDVTVNFLTVALCGVLVGATVSRFGGRGGLATASWLAIAYFLMLVVYLPFSVAAHNDAFPGTFIYEFVECPVPLGILIGAALGALRRHSVVTARATRTHRT